MLDLVAQSADAGHRVVDLPLAVVDLALAAVGGLRSLAAGARYLVGGHHHFMEGGGNHVHCFPLARRGVGHFQR